MKKHLLLLVVFLLSTAMLSAQKTGLDQKVNLNFQQVPLEDALEDISTACGVKFSYSRDFVPVDKRVSVRVRNRKLSSALDELFSSTKVVYTPIGDQIVLKMDPRKRIKTKNDDELTGSLSNAPGPVQPQKTYTSVPIPFREPVKPSPTPLRTPTLSPVPWSEEFLQPEEDFLNITEMGTAPENTRLTAQVSFLPHIGTNMGRSSEKTNNVSVNMLWGKNGGVDGVEVGGLVNTIETNMYGLQVAGLMNNVRGEVGTATVVRKNGKIRGGAQVSGLSNVAGRVEGAQITGGFNRVYFGDLDGFQIAALGNTVRGNAKGFQVAGLYNANRGNGELQIAALINIAKDVEKAQIGMLINVARNVNGVQIGLINVCDSIDGVSIGLLNFVKHGYNRLEVSHTDLFDAYLSVKFGSRRFYNILEIASLVGKDKNTIYSGEIAWAFGYGIGTSLGKKRWTWQAEAVAKHINEGPLWFDKVNFLAEFRMTLDWRLAKHLSLFGGPVYYVFTTEKHSTENGDFSSQFIQESPLHESVQPGPLFRLTQGWLGYKIGLRF